MSLRAGAVRGGRTRTSRSGGLQLLDLQQVRLPPSDRAGIPLLLSGADALTTYRFNTGTARHLFCSVCGIKSFYVPRSHPDGYSVNARCLDDGTVEHMTVTPTDGRNWEQAYPAGRGQWSEG
jgi:hypothetical protein